ncbi:hypothetical protein PGIGA_G00197290 [Pangasianodon gigas]|uniref:Uncharacterized protein n=1 Tax=Pangasianodon gigas TaxID=30993 RepID=A0ACC5XXZ8_PANGG|nr:hypothetical protein [Pangasianodon gigas]
MPESKAAQVIQLFLQEYGVADVWRFWSPTSKGYSFYSSVHKTFSRIDFFFFDKLFPKVVTCEYQSIVISDHGPLTMKMC